MHPQLEPLPVQFAPLCVQEQGGGGGGGGGPGTTGVTEPELPETALTPYPVTVVTVNV